MTVSPHGRHRHAPATLSVFCDRLSRAISPSKTPHAWQGFEVTDGTLPDGSITQVVMLGPQRDDKSPDAKSRAIPLASDPGKAPKILTVGEGRVLHGSLQENANGNLELVRQPSEGMVTRIFRTGLIRPKEVRNPKEAKAHRQRDLGALRTAGIRLHYHGVFPLENGTINIVAEGETVDVIKLADVFDLTDPEARKMRGIDVAESREMGAEIPIGGAVLCVDLGHLTIHERRGQREFKIWDVTGDPDMWKQANKLIEDELNGKAAEARKIVDAASREVMAST